MAGNDEIFNAALLQHGFRKEDRAGHLRMGFYHPDHLAYGFQQVSGRVFVGRAERDRLVRMTVRPDNFVMLPAIEDLVTHRLAQYAVAAQSDTSRLAQAKMMLRLAERIDWAYLERRAAEEGGDLTLLTRGG